MTYTIVDVVPDSPEWEQERRNSIGASEVAAVLGLSPWQTQLGVYRSKMGIDDPFDPELAYIGHAEEVTIEGWIRKFRPEVGDILPALMVRSVEYPWLHASLDRRALRDGVEVPVQMKTAHQFAGKEWEHETPMLVQAQVQTEILVFDAPFAWAVGFVGGRKFHLHPIARDEEFIQEHLIPKTEQFWRSHVVPRIAPPPTTLGELADVYPTVKGTEIAGSDTVLEAVDRRAVLLSDIAAQKEEADQLTLAIGQYMGANETLVDQSGIPIITYRSQQGRRTADLDLLESKYPAIAVEVIRRGDPFKVMRAAAKKKENAR